ncbi:hypothetical protein PG993_015226 [Apiospora rasikravindrae]|uniref:Uncharacterized protein n=1 Tax=Apiospora rasikravindrae TaxID=990691 RepID=A0ABR1RQA0_9PEZI
MCKVQRHEWFCTQCGYRYAKDHNNSTWDPCDSSENYSSKCPNYEPTITEHQVETCPPGKGCNKPPPPVHRREAYAPTPAVTHSHRHSAPPSSTTTVTHNHCDPQPLPPTTSSTPRPSSPAIIMCTVDLHLYMCWRCNKAAKRVANEATLVPCDSHENYSSKCPNFAPAITKHYERDLCMPCAVEIVEEEVAKDEQRAEEAGKD